MKRPALTLLVLLSACRSPAPAAHEDGAASKALPVWQVVAHDLPAALLSIDGTSADDILAVGADKGDGPVVVHFDGHAWSRLSTGEHGDLWWVHAFPDHTALMAGAGGTVLRFDGHAFTRLSTPALSRQTVYGVWGKSADDFYAVGSAAGRNGFIWRYHGGAFADERVPLDVPRTAAGELPGFFKVWGTGDEVWVVGAAGTVLHRKGDAPFADVPSGTKETLFTIHGSNGRVVTVGGSSNGVAVTSKGHGFHDVSPHASPLLQGVYTAADGDWASGERGDLYLRRGDAPFERFETGLSLPVASSLHAVFVDPSQGVWAVGGDVLSPALDHGMMVHFGPPVPELTVEPPPPAPTGPAVMCPKAVLVAGKGISVARRWDEQALAAIRLDLPRPTVHARNLFHTSAAMWDAWAAYHPTARAVFVPEREPVTMAGKGPDAAISYAAYGVLSRRYAHAVGHERTEVCLRSVMADLGYDPDDHHEGKQGDGDPIALGNRIARTIVDATAHDGANEQNDYADTTGYRSPNAPLVYDNPGATMVDPNVWQPLNLSVAATQNGIVQPAGVQTYIGAQWGAVTPFAMTRRSPSLPWQDGGPIPRVGEAMKGWLVEVIEKSAAGDPADKTTIDISPGAYGNNSLGANDGKGYAKNPVTGKPYAPNVVLRADFARVMAEFWADGPHSETPPGHWNVLANEASDAPQATHKLFGKGEPLDRLAWDLHVYLALNGAVHDAAIAAWDLKRRDVSSRAICLIRWMGAKGQSSDPKGPSYDPGGLPLVPGLIEVVTAASSAPGQRHEKLAYYVGQVVVRDWLGEPADRSRQIGGTAWVRAIDWIPYQRRNFVTPAFPGFISGHSTFSRAGAEVLAGITGSPYFPGGFAEFVAKRDSFLMFEHGPTTDVHLQWASYMDASDEAGQSRLWGGIHIRPDDMVGRRIGSRVGKAALARASTYFGG